MLGQEGVFSSDRIPTFPPLRIPVIADMPIVGPLLSGHTLLVYLAYLLVPVVAFFLYRTRWGLRVRVVGEAEDAAAAAGINIFAIKFQTMLLSGLFCGLAGAYLSLGYVSLFAKQMTNERGLIALAAIFFANGNPYWTAAVALLVRHGDRAFGSAAAGDGGRAPTPSAHPLCRHGARARCRRRAQDARAQPPRRLAIRAVNARSVLSA